MQRIIDTVKLSPPAPLPDNIEISISTYNKKWAIAITKDNRTNASYQEDYWPQTAVLLRKNFSTLRWEALELFEDYSENKFLEWQRYFGFTRDDAKDLGLEY